ncbi:hypothetical protein ACFW1A_10220 [Kitasatospora sp. NPDC058965]|uniref:hypothetical protein n=1 Tax=Kitasatospora sp. NPDC058965 TaxID=3346682 RepID=UPI0036BE7B75
MGADAHPLRRARAPLGAEHRQAAHELNLAATLVLSQPEAAASLHLLAEGEREVHPGGALVLGALLHLTGHAEACQFWLQFAAGGGNPTAASCLALLHASRGEHRDAAFWRQQVDRLATQTSAPPRATDLPWAPLPDTLWTDTLARCHEGVALRLPPRVAAVVHQLPVLGADADLGDIPQPSPSLVRDLTRAAPSGRVR